ncbi:hydrolase [Bacillus obstructivus]|nr:alpha/beta fold hydrolase [Bacillus sp. Gen3]OJH20179.1 hydrolase [Bacillus obstructivus]
MSKENKRQLLWSLLGDLPEKQSQITIKKINEEEKEEYFLEELLMNTFGNTWVPAYITRPKKAKGKLPAVLFNHSHGGNYQLGKNELIESSAYLQTPSFAEELSKMGYTVLCLDMWGFGERRGKSESEIFKEMLWKGQVMWGMMIYDNVRAIDYLSTREDIDRSKIATLGMSMGGLMAWWLAALDERISVCIDIAAQVEAHSLIRCRGLDHHGLYSYVPKLLKYFQTSDIQALIAPRPHLSLVGNHDRLTPAQGLDIIDETLSITYDQLGRQDNWKMLRYECGHIETAGMRSELCSFLQEHL